MDASLQVIATALAGTSLDVLMSAIHKDKSQTSRIRSGEIGCSINDTVRLLYAVGFKVVAADVMVVDRVAYEAVAACVFKAMSDPEIFHRVMMSK